MTEAGGEWIHLQGFIKRHGHKQALVNTQQTDIDEARQRVFLGQAWVFDRRTVSNRARQREIIQVHSNNPGRGKHNPKQQGKGLNQDTQARIKTGKARL